MNKFQSKRALSDLLIDQGVFIVDKQRLGNTDKEVRIVRDDFVEGGTKSRVLHKELRDYANGKELVYPATPYGYGQIALSNACRILNRNARVFGPQLQELSAEQTATIKNNAFFSGVPINQNEKFDKIVKFAQEYAKADPANREFINPGFSSQEFIDLTAETIMSIRQQLKEIPSQVWSVGGSGALSAALQEVFPEAEHRIITVRHNSSKYGVDCNSRNASKVYSAPEEFEQAAQHPPPFPSSKHYEAKLWQVLIDNEDEVAPDALVWNM